MASLGLVAYNSSDDEESDGESQPNYEPNSKQKHVGNAVNEPSGHISDEEEYEAQTVTAPDASYSSVTREFTEQSSISVPNNYTVSSFKDLPTPKSKTVDSIHADDELEEEVKPKAAEIESAQKPPGKKRQPVKITIPSLEETSNGEEELLKKKPIPSQIKSGLFSLLPPPKYSSKKEINRPLIPLSLTKKPSAKTVSSSQPPKVIHKPPSSSSTTQKVSLNVAMYGSDSEDDEEVTSSNFFSLDSSNKPLSDTLASSKSVSTQNSISKDIQPDSSSSIEMKESTDEQQEDPRSEPGAVNDAPLDFGFKSTQQAWSAPVFSHCHLGAVGKVGQVADTPASSIAFTDVEDSGDQPQEEVADDDLKQFMSDKEFQRLSGKRKRGLEQAITFMDANVDDYVDPSELSKHLTEESEYVSHKSKDNMPTAQQRRKKQITYLAYQAKEKELELKNQWADNRMTKKQTQSKYGF